MRLRLIATLAAAALISAVVPGFANASVGQESLYTPRACIASAVPTEVVVHYRAGTSAAERGEVREETGTTAEQAAPGNAEAVAPADGESVARTVRELEARPEVESAVPNLIAHASGFFPNDPGEAGRPGGWEDIQWNFAGQAGVNAPDAWEHAILAGAPGGRGAVVAVLDTGVAYSTRGRYRRAPDFYANRWVRGHDYVDHDRFGQDKNGHGTHVTATIAERVHNNRAVTGLAYGVRVMPVRVLDECGDGDAVAIARGIRFAARRGADVINMSFEFEQGVRGSQIPDILAAIRYAHRRGAVVVAASGNHIDDSPTPVSYPARALHVVAVGATTENRCQAEYSNEGDELDIVAPGGGFDARNSDNPRDAASCDPNRGGRDIIQQTFSRSIRSFGLPRGFEGTSMAAPHVAAAAALVIGTRRVGTSPSPDAVFDRLAQTAADLGPDGFDSRYGWGLLDAAAAIDPNR